MLVAATEGLKEGLVMGASLGLVAEGKAVVNMVGVDELLAMGETVGLLLGAIEGGVLGV
jgi:hypothetical protein